MARRRRTSTAIVVSRAAPRYSAPRPIIVRAPAPVKHRRRRRSGGGGISGMLGGSSGIVAIAIASAVIGLAEKSGLLAKLPTIPLVGRKGALALGAAYYAKHGGGSLARDVAIAAAALSGYELGNTGAISGDD